MKKVGIIKQKIAICLIFLMCINSFGAVVSDNDGSAFITKAEFDSLKNNFQSQIAKYNQSFDGKIDGAIASYLSGIMLKNMVILDSELNKVKLLSELDSDYKFGKNFNLTTTKPPDGVSHAVFYQAFGMNSSGSSGGIAGVFQIMDDVSKSYGGHRFQPSTNDYGTSNYFVDSRIMEIENVSINGTKYNKLTNKTRYSTHYYWRLEGSSYRWIHAAPKSMGNANNVGLLWIDKSDMLYDGMDANNQVSWDLCQKDVDVGGYKTDGTDIWGQGESGTGVWQGKATQSFTARVRSYYTVTKQDYISSVGYGADSVPDNDIYCIYNDQWNNAWWDDTSEVGTAGYGGLFNPLPTGCKKDTGIKLAVNTNQKRMPTAELAYEYPIYRHKIEKIPLDSIINNAAQRSAFTAEPTYFYSGLPVVYCSTKGNIELKLKATATKKNDGSSVSDTVNWSGKLYLNYERFEKNTTASHVYDIGQTLYTGSWGFSNTDKEKTIKIHVPDSTEVWLKYVPDSASEDVLVEFSTVEDTIVEELIY